MSSDSNWKRPFIAGYSTHTVCFLAIQILVLSRIFTAIETEYIMKLRAMMACDLLSGLFIVIGIVRTLPYLKKVFEEKEIVIENGPSLITEILPNFILSLIILAVSAILFMADYSIYKTVTLKYALIIYCILGIAGLIVSIYSVESYLERTLTSCTIISVCLSGSQWFSDLGIIVIVAISVCLWSFMSWRETRLLSDTLTQTEIEISRARSIFLLIVLLAILTKAVNPFGIPALFAVGACNMFRYIQDRRLGTVSERISIRSALFVSPGV